MRPTPTTVSTGPHVAQTVPTTTAPNGIKITTAATYLLTPKNEVLRFPPGTTVEAIREAVTHRQARIALLNPPEPAPATPAAVTEAAAAAQRVYAATPVQVATTLPTSAVVTTAITLPAASTAASPAPAPAPAAGAKKPAPGTAGDGAGGSTASTSVQHADELMGGLRRKHPALTSDIEAMLEEVIVRFKPNPEEELHSAVDALLSKGGFEV